MSDKDIPASGSRWEPADHVATPHHGTPAEGPTVPAPDGRASEPAAVPVALSPLPDRPGRCARLPRRLRGRKAVAAAGVGFVLAGGLGGFAIAHPVAGTGVPDGVDDADQDVPGGPRDGGPGGRPGAGRDGHGPGAPSDGTQDDGSAPDAPPGADGGGTA